jgi:hypothetical protein
MKDFLVSVWWIPDVPVASHPHLGCVRVKFLRAWHQAAITHPGAAKPSTLAAHNML